jgi:hypothetical protein
MWQRALSLSNSEQRRRHPSNFWDGSFCEQEHHSLQPWGRLGSACRYGKFRHRPTPRQHHTRLLGTSFGRGDKSTLALVVRKSGSSLSTAASFRGVSGFYFAFLRPRCAIRNGSFRTPLISRSYVISTCRLVPSVKNRTIACPSSVYFHVLIVFPSACSKAAFVRCKIGFSSFAIQRLYASHEPLFWVPGDHERAARSARCGEYVRR